MTLLEDFDMKASTIQRWFPQTLLLLENHLCKPVRTHNDKRLKHVLKVQELSHDFVEGNNKNYIKIFTKAAVFITMKLVLNSAYFLIPGTLVRENRL